MTAPPNPRAARSRRAWLVAAACHLAAVTAPYLIGPLSECDHCIENYTRTGLIAPGVLPVSMMRLEPGSIASYAVATVVTALLVGSIRVAAGRSSWTWRSALVVLTLADGYACLGYSALLRM